MNINLRLSTENDLPLIEGYVRAYHDFDGVAHHSEETARAIQPLLGQSALGRVWLICVGTEPVGYVAVCFGYTIEFSGRDAFIDEMFIVKEHRGKGIGKAVFSSVKAQAAQLGIKVLHLEVARTNERAQRVYRSAGFVPRERFFLMSAPTDAKQGAPAAVARTQSGAVAQPAEKVPGCTRATSFVGASMEARSLSNQMLIAWCGPAYVIGTILSVVMIAGFIPPPPAYLTADQVASLYQENLFRIRFGLFLSLAATSLLTPFSVGIAIQMIRREGMSPVLAWTQLATGAIGTLVLIIAFIIMMAASFDPQRPAEITKAIHDLGWLMLLLPYSPFCIQYIAIGIAVLQDSSRHPLFPRWVAYFNFWVALSFIPTGLVVFFSRGPFTWHGLMGFWIPVISYGAWFIVMFVALRAAIRAATHADAPY